jgi:hypothetical protein
MRPDNSKTPHDCQSAAHAKSEPDQGHLISGDACPGKRCAQTIKNRINQAAHDAIKHRCFLSNDWLPLREGRLTPMGTGLSTQC